jgi:hypothetical protein
MQSYFIASLAGLTWAVCSQSHKVALGVLIRVSSNYGVWSSFIRKIPNQPGAMPNRGVSSCAKTIGVLILRYKTIEPGHASYGLPLWSAYLSHALGQANPAMPAQKHRLRPVSAQQTQQQQRPPQ